MQSVYSETQGAEIISLDDINVSKIITISAKISLPESIAINTIAEICHVSKSSLVRAAIARLIRDFYAAAPESLADPNKGLMASAVVVDEQISRCLERLSKKEPK
ncbi:hypothetical protein [Acidilobus sp.]|jgi:predicted transcriptional regulator|uniref:hypothetical protein n=1 Tax=Acidilobus sp. TaxID=1872109 RepID=UPI003CFE0090